ncbi:MAG: MBL fold metallo-hydrolase [Candidatus Heimdallarchaeota archaeon]
MTIRFRVIASGSNGNSAYISTPEGTLLIDAGISRKRIINALQEDKIPLNDVIGILVTHAHTDHCQGLPVLCDHLKGVPLLFTSGTKDVLHSYNSRDPRYAKISDNSYLLSFDEPFMTGNFSVTSLRTTHDVQGSAAFQISYKDTKVTFLTDTGKIETKHLKALKESSIVLVEMNHDITALNTSRRPIWLKKRVRSAHLANSETIEILDSLIDSEIRGFFIGHVSGECNSPKLVAESLGEWQLARSIPWNWYFCHRDRSGEVVEYSNNQLATDMKEFLPKMPEKGRKFVKIEKF